MDAQQELFTYFVETLRKAGYDVYDTDLPDLNVDYPFIYIGPTQDIYDPYKSGRVGTAVITIDAWSDRPDLRGSFSLILDDVKKYARNLAGTAGHTWLLSGCNQQILTDSSTPTPLMHGVIDLTFKYTER